MSFDVNYQQFLYLSTKIIGYILDQARLQNIRKNPYRTYKQYQILMRYWQKNVSKILVVKVNFYIVIHIKCQYYINMKLPIFHFAFMTRCLPILARCWVYWPIFKLWRNLNKIFAQYCVLPGEPDVTLNAPLGFCLINGVFFIDLLMLTQTLLKI